LSRIIRDCGGVFAFEMGEPVGEFPSDPFELLTDEQLRQIIVDYEAILGVVGGGKVVFKVNVPRNNVREPVATSPSVAFAPLNNSGLGDSIANVS